MAAARIYLLRHGETAWNLENKYQGQLDTPLNEAGRRQATQAAEWFSRRKIDAIHSSDLSRARETADSVGAACGLAPVTAPELRERHMGAFQGLSFAEIQDRFPETRRKDYRTFDRIPGGETADAFLARVVGAVESIAEKYDGGRILLVSHGGFIYYWLRHLAGLPVLSDFHVKVANASIHILDARSGGWTINAMGLTEHLGGEDVKELD